VKPPPSPGMRRVRGGCVGSLQGLSAVLPVVASLLLAASPCRAAWPGDPVSNLPICTSPLSQDVPQIIPDGSGGVIIVWQATGISGVKGVFAQRVDREGQAVWDEKVIAVCRLESDQEQPMLVPDSSGGAIVVWQDFRSGDNWDVFAQRIDRSGNLRWSDGGVSISTAAGDQLGPQIAADGHGGALIAWQDLREGPDSDLYAQAVDSTGQVQWSVDGIPILAGPGTQLVSQVVKCGPGGVFVWGDSRGGGTEVSIYAQRVDASGSPMWGPSGVLVEDGAAPDAHPVSIPDGRGGVIVAWESGPIYAQRLDASGSLLWGDDGAALSTADGSAPAIVHDGDGGAIVAWQTDSPEDEASDVRAQSVRASGALRWGTDGMAVCQASGAQTEVAVTEAAAGGAIVMWRDARNDPFGDLYAQRVDSTAAVLWQADGIVVSNAPGFQSSLTVCSDGFGGAVAAWTDGRAGRHIYAQRVAPRGRLGGDAGADHPKPRRRPRPPVTGGGTGSPSK
jgi:hypothetical protein